MENESAVLYIDASFSGMEIYVPKTWRIEDKTNTTFGGIEEKNRNDFATDHILTLVGDISFSGVEIIYV